MRHFGAMLPSSPATAMVGFSYGWTAPFPVFLDAGIVIPMVLIPVMIGLLYPRRFLAASVIVSSLASLLVPLWCVIGVSSLASALARFSFDPIFSGIVSMAEGTVMAVPLCAFLAAGTFLLAHPFSALSRYSARLCRIQEMIGRLRWLDKRYLLGSMMALQLTALLPTFAFFDSRDSLYLLVYGAMGLAGLRVSDAHGVQAPSHPHLILLCNALTPVVAGLILRWAYVKGGACQEHERPSAALDKGWRYWILAAGVLLLSGWLLTYALARGDIRDLVAPAVSAGSND